VFVPAVQFSVNLRGIRHELARVLHVRVRKQRVVRRLSVIAARVSLRGEFVEVRCGSIVGRGACVKFDCFVCCHLSHFADWERCPDHPFPRGSARSAGEGRVAAKIRLDVPVQINVVRDVEC